MAPPASVKDVFESGMCIGCGLCEALTGGRVTMEMTVYGALRPARASTFEPEEETQILSACPGAVARARVQTDAHYDPIWGAFSQMAYGWAGDPDVRFRAATGGVLTALGMHLLKSGQATFILHVAADPNAPMRSTWVMSETPDEVAARAGSRYGPAPVLAGLMAALDREEPFAVIAKPCDLGAIHALAASDVRIDRLCVAQLAMVCGGQSRLTKSAQLLEEFGVREEELSTFRYRGFGNPGLTTVETMDGRRFHKTYQELWEDEGTWELETRCKLCADALGEAADLAAADVWPGGGPTGEDAGFNGIITRSAVGDALLARAVEAGDLVVGETITPEMFNDFQPHQVRKKHNLQARFDGMAAMGLPVMGTQGLRIAELGQTLSPEARAAQMEGVKTRIADGRFLEDFGT